MFQIALLIKKEFDSVLGKICNLVLPNSNGRQSFITCGLKGLRRSLEKAVLDYSKEQDEQGGLHKVIDIVRGSIMCETVSEMKAIFRALESSDKFEIVRFKNLFRDLDATHFRRMAVNLVFEVSIGERRIHHVAELQVHLRDIFRFKQENKDLMHKPYEFFRELGEKVKVMSKLKKQMDTMHEVVQTPVLLSLFCTTVELEGDKAPKLPESVSELYQTAMNVRLKDNDELRQLLQALALENFLEGRREFTISHVEKVQQARGCNSILDFGLDKPIPLIKVLDSSAGLFQFAHLSFQEALASHELHGNDVAKQNFASRHLLTRKAVNFLKFCEDGVFPLPETLNGGNLGEFKPKDIFADFKQFLRPCRVDTVIKIDFSNSYLSGEVQLHHPPFFHCFDLPLYRFDSSGDCEIDELEET